MGVAMLGEGERLESRRRRKFWTVLGGILVAGMLTGLVSGYVAADSGVSTEQAWALMPDGLVIAIVGFGLIAFNIGCWLFMRSIDEVELSDNLWGSTFGFYIYAMLFPSWWALGKAGVAPEPKDWVIFFIALAGGCAAYLWRKWRAR